MRHVAFVVLNLLLVTSKLVLNLVNTLIHRRLRSGTHFSSHEIMLVLCRNQDLHVPGLLALIDGNLDRHQPTKVLEQLFRFIV